VGKTEEKKESWFRHKNAEAFFSMRLLSVKHLLKVPTCS